MQVSHAGAAGNPGRSQRARSVPPFCPPGPGRLALALLMGPAARPAAALQDETNGGGDTADLLTPDSGVYFGSILDGSADSVEDQADRLGSPSAVYEHAAGVPLPESSKLYLDQFLDQVQSQGALPVITLTPTVDLSDVDAGVADALVENLVDVLRDRDLPACLSTLRPRHGQHLDVVGATALGVPAGFRQCGRRRVRAVNIFWSV